MNRLKIGGDYTTKIGEKKIKVKIMGVMKALDYGEKHIIKWYMIKFYYGPFKTEDKVIKFNRVSNITKNSFTIK